MRQCKNARAVSLRNRSELQPPRPASRHGGGLLQQFADRGEIKVEDPAIAADLFLSLLLGNTDKHHGIATRPKIREQRRQAAVKLFLNGVRPR